MKEKLLLEAALGSKDCSLVKLLLLKVIMLNTDMFHGKGASSSLQQRS